MLELQTTQTKLSKVNLQRVSEMHHKMAAYVTEILMNSATEKAIQFIRYKNEIEHTPTPTQHHYTGTRVDT